MPRKSEVPMIAIRTYHITEPFGVVDKAKVAFWDGRMKLFHAGVSHRVDVMTATVVEGV